MAGVAIVVGALIYASQPERQKVESTIRRQL
jgi:hypothetical protein